METILFDADLWPLNRPKTRVSVDPLFKPDHEPLYLEQHHGQLEVSLTKPKQTTGFQKGLPEKVVHVPIVVPKISKAVFVPSDPFKRSQLGGDAFVSGPAGLRAQGEATAQASPTPEVAADAADATAMVGAIGSADTSDSADPAQVADASETLDSVASGTSAASESGLSEDAAADAPAQTDQDAVPADQTDLPDATVPSVESGPQSHSADAQAAYEEGRQAGIQEAQSMQAAALEAAVAQAYEKGRSEAEAAIREELSASMAPSREALASLTNQLTEAARDTDAFFVPLKRLAMHLAEQMVRGELSLSGKAIGRLIERSLAELSQDPSQPVVVTLNPDDLLGFQAMGAELPKGMTLRSDERLASGSIRVSMNGAVIEDLIEHRRQQLWQALMQEDQPAPPSSFLQSVEQVKDVFDDIFEDLDHEQH